MKAPSKNMKTQGKKTITIDITEWYDRIKDISKKEIRSIEEQCKFFIKNGVDNVTGNTFVTSIEWTPTYGNHLWDGHFSTSPNHDHNVVYCNCENSISHESDGDKTKSNHATIDCDFDYGTGMYQCKRCGSD